VTGALTNSTGLKSPNTVRKCPDDILLTLQLTSFSNKPITVHNFHYSSASLYVVRYYMQPITIRIYVFIKSSIQVVPVNSCIRSVSMLLFFYRKLVAKCKKR
jgi:hypothetical protein